MKKSVLFLTFVVAIFMSMSFVIATNHTGGDLDLETSSANLEGVDKAYQCLENEIEEKSVLSFEDKVFSLLAIGNKFNLESELNEEKNSINDCWPKTSCKVTETSQALLALNRIGANTAGVEEWLLERNGTADDLAWYLEVDTDGQVASSCSVTYDGGDHNFQIRDDATLTGSPGSCLSISSSDYLLRIRDDCLDKEFDLTCDQDFVSTLIYQKEGAGAADCLDNTDNACFVSGETHSASSLGTTTERVRGSCFMSGGRCDYEGTLWATLALSKTGENVNEFIPYLLALAEDNLRYFPDAFLSVLIGDDESYNNIIQQRVQGQFWEIDGSAQNRFHDTALGMMALNSGSGSSELSSSQEYLLGIQTRNGCWNNDNVRDTGFLLYAGWGKSSVSGSSGGGTGSGGELCESAGFFCERGNVCTSAGGTIHNNFECTNVGVCCSIQVTGPSCTAEGGVNCQAGSQCDGAVFEAGDGSACCLGACIPTAVTNVCEQQVGGNCKFSCGDGEEVTGDSCGLDTGSVCCVAQGDGSSGSGSNALIWLLVVLVILALLGFIFRNKIQLWWHKRKGKFKSKPVDKRVGPGASRPAMARRPPMMGMRRPMARRPLARRPAHREKELDDTLRKLREMGK